MKEIEEIKIINIDDEEILKKEKEINELIKTLNSKKKALLEESEEEKKNFHLFNQLSSPKSKKK